MRACVGLCFAWWTQERRVAEIRGAALGPAIPLDGMISDLDVSPDGTHLAYARTDAIVVVDTTTHEAEQWPRQSACSLGNRFVRWTPDGAALDVSQQCDTLASHLLRIAPHRAPVEVFSTPASIAGFVIAPDGDLVLNLERFTKSLVRFENL